jgi:hypothetical protein
MYKIKKTANAVECMNAILLHRNQRHVSATHAAVFGVARTRIQSQLMCRNPSTVKNLYNFCLNAMLKEYNVGDYRILVDEKVGIYGVWCMLIHMLYSFIIAYQSG